MLTGDSLNPKVNKSITSENYPLVQHCVRDLMTLTKSKGHEPVAKQWYDLQYGLREIDGLLQRRYVEVEKVKDEKKEEGGTFNANTESGGK